MNLILLFGSVAVLAGAIAEPTSIAAPSFKVGDTWVFDDTQQRGTTGFNKQRIDLVVERVGGDTMLVGYKRDGAPTAFEDHIVGPDWSQRQVVDGQELPTTRPLNFPMQVGQKWTVDFTDTTRRSNQLSVHVHRTYVATAWEEISVPAGTYRALKIEAKGASEAVVVTPNTVVGGATASPLGGSTFTRSQPGGTSTRTARNYDEIYYVPKAKNYVKSVEEQYNSQDVLVSRNTREMISFRPAT